jgi:hypothetical protein
MAQAIREGRKTQTRRIWNCYAPKSRYRVGDLLWVRETARVVDCDPVGKIQYEYKDGEKVWRDFYVRERYQKFAKITGKWVPSIFLPFEASRIWLEIKNVRIERVNDITEQDATAEGLPHNKNIPADYGYEARGCFASLWDRLNEKRGYGWNKNPWVFVYDFKRRGECL